MSSKSSAPPARWAGADGSPGGWVLAVLDASRSLLSLRLVKTFAELAVEVTPLSLTLVDIPIGLPSAEWPHDRQCDGMARSLLGPRASSVFPVPAREAAWAESYEAAGSLNREILRRGLSRQSWNICPKIRDADAVFRMVPGLQQRVRETHPELCFWLLNNGHPLETPKKSPAGLRVRRELLRSWIPNLDAALRLARRAYPASRVGSDDLLDAAVAAVVASLAAEGRAASLPLAPERDACGLAMEIVGA